jgi:hypothetical protein
VRGRGAVAATLLAALALAGCASGPPARGGGWLDRPLASWNQAGGVIPRAPEPNPQQAGNRERCRSGIRTPASAPDRAVSAAGWWLAGPATVFGETTVLVGAADWDGMCRPWSYQAFVFVRDRFAGTLSPALMDARTDGAFQSARLASPFYLSGDFVRYTPTDALCCPSRLSEVAYKVDATPAGPLVVAQAVVTRPLPR